MEIIEIRFSKGLLDIHRRTEGMLETFFNIPRPLFIDSGRRQWVPATDIFETAEGIIIISELAGVNREDIDVSLEGDLVKISGIRRNPISQPKRMHQMELEFGYFERFVKIPMPIDLDGIQATYTDGLLKVFLPKKRAGKVEKVEIVNDI